MNKKLLIIPVFALLLASSGATAYAYGNTSRSEFDPANKINNFGEKLQNQAELLGLDIDTMKNYWAEGKNIREIAEEKGISAEDLQAKQQEHRLAKLKVEMNLLVSQGQITQEQADTRLKVMSEKKAFGPGFGYRGACQGEKGQRLGKGMHQIKEIK